MDLLKSKQSEGYDYLDYAEISFNALGGVATPYLVGTQANVAIQGSWPTQTGVYLPNPLYLPFDAQNTMFYATQPCLLRLINNALWTQQLGGVLPIGFPVQIAVPAGVWFTFPDKWFLLYVVGSTVNAGVLRVKASG